MFVTDARYHGSVQFDLGVNVWDVVEIELDVPFFIATVLCEPERLKRRFLISTTQNIEHFVLEAPEGKLLTLDLVQPPRLSKAGCWTFIQIKSIKKLRPSANAELFFISRCGLNFLGPALKSQNQVPDSLIDFCDL
jgi:hypothetical protein